MNLAPPIHVTIIIIIIVDNDDDDEKKERKKKNGCSYPHTHTRTNTEAPPLLCNLRHIKTHTLLPAPPPVSTRDRDDFMTEIEEESTLFSKLIRIVVPSHHKPRPLQNRYVCANRPLTFVSSSKEKNNTRIVSRRSEMMHTDFCANEKQYRRTDRQTHAHTHTHTTPVTENAPSYLVDGRSRPLLLWNFRLLGMVCTFLTKKLGPSGFSRKN